MKKFCAARKSALLIIGVGTIILLIILLFSLHHQGRQYICAIEDGRFYVKGMIGTAGDQTEVHFREFTEYKTEKEHGIVNLDRAYYAVGNQYYYGDRDGSNRVLIQDEHEPEEIFSRESMFSNRDFSKLRFCCEGSEELLDIETMEKKFRHYEEYRFVDTEDCIRLYFSGDQLYAIRAREDARYILYVLSFLEQPPV